jgi:hypothetical protein
MSVLPARHQRRGALARPHALALLHAVEPPAAPPLLVVCIRRIRAGGWLGRALVRPRVPDRGLLHLGLGGRILDGEDVRHELRVLVRRAAHGQQQRLEHDM